MVTTFLKLTNNWGELEKKTAADWLKQGYGPTVYQLLWEPLLKGKFSLQAETIAMSWFWARIKKRSQRLGYLEGGFQTLVERLKEEIEKKGGQVLLGHGVKNLVSLRKKFDQLIVTTPTATFLKIAPELPPEYQEKLSALKTIGALSFVLILKER